MEAKTLLLITIVCIGIISYLLLIINAMKAAKRCECQEECTCGEDRQILSKKAFADFNPVQYESRHH
jgi:hypothetical protein